MKKIAMAILIFLMMGNFLTLIFMYSVHRKERAMNKTSEQLNEIFSALAKAQGQIQAAVKDKSNPYFKSSYSTLDACWDSCRAPLTSNGLSVVQTINESEGGKMFITTILGHSSGQFISSTVPLL